MRAVIEVKKDADAEKILQYLFKYSDLQTTFGVNMVAIAGGKPLQMGLLELVRHYIEYRREVCDAPDPLRSRKREATRAYPRRADDRYSIISTR